jgi:hypothetical protein
MAAPKGNTNAEKWTLKESIKFFDKAVELSDKLDYDFIGEVAKDLKQDKGVFDYLVEKFPNKGFNKLKRRIKYNCEVNCFRNAKKGDIIPSLAIMNLKSNHGWTDRVDTTTKGESISTIERTIVRPNEVKD